LKPEQWGSPLVQEKYQEEKACDKRHPYRIIMPTNIVAQSKMGVGVEVMVYPLRILARISSIPTET